MSLDDPQLSPHAHDLMADTGNELLLSPASYWELAIKVSLGKYQLAETLDEFVNREVQTNDLSILPIQPVHAAQVVGLPFHHRDPFDRLLVAQAIVEQAALVSKDAIFDSYGIKREW
jgi:PIN domain nuclease of toxin-antitoxin system